MASTGTYALVTIEEARDYLKRETAKDDARLATFIDYATAAIETYTRRKLVSRAYDGTANPKMVVNGRGRRWILPREYPITALASATYIYDDGTTRDLDISHFRILTGHKVFLPYDVFPLGEANIELSITCGYKAGTHDTELRTLKLACLRFLQVMWQDREQAVGRGATLSVGGSSLTVIDVPIPKDIALALRPFERMGF